MNCPSLLLGDEIRIVSPGGAIDNNLICEASQVISNMGYTLSIGKYATGKYGRYSGTVNQRCADLQNALDDPQVKAIICARGGYGTVQLLEKLDFTRFVQNPKWIVGYSDISVLHSAVNRLGINSLHAGMMAQIATLGAEDISVKSIFTTLKGKNLDYELESHPQNKFGTAVGQLVGGNLSVLAGLRATPYDLNYDSAILFIEDVNEKIYHIDRMLQNLRLSGVFEKINGLIVGHFTDCVEDKLMKISLKKIILNAVSGYHFPVCFDFPAGHQAPNMPLILGSKVELQVNEKNIKLQYIK
ncbi:MAG: LD-carboxypeptidase [Paludibacter sp.]|jgi:muramoyltetrapeptide carboxypeptidase|nr:LD-carboxypeptidase [Paludibacter sp.]